MADHGTTRRYQTGCRCDECAAAARVYMRKYRSTETGKTRTLVSAKIQRLLLQECLAYVRKKDPVLLETWRIKIRRKVLAEQKNRGRSDAE